MQDSVEAGDKETTGVAEKEREVHMKNIRSVAVL